MNEDFSDIISKFSEILKEKNIDINNLNVDNCQNNHETINNNESGEFNLDIETIFKIKDILSKVNSCKDLPRNHLLHSLKPYLKDEKQSKLDQYIQIANLLSVVESMDLGINFLKHNKKGYDFILIITLVLLII